MTLLTGHIYVPKRALKNKDIELGMKMLLADSKEVNQSNSVDFFCLTKHKTRNSFVIYTFSAKGDWQNLLHHLNDVVSNQMIFVSFLIKIKELDLAFYFDALDSNKRSSSGTLFVAGYRIDNFRLSTAPASLMTMNQF